MVFLYQKIASLIASDIEAGLYITGDKLPSLRNMVQLHQISLATAVQALNLLVDQGLLEAKNKSGYYVIGALTAAVPAMSKPPSKARIVSVGQLAQSLVAESQSKKLIRLGAAVPGGDLLPLAKLSRSLAGVARRHYKEAGVYGESQGHILLRRQIARLMANGACRCSPDQIIITNGCLEALTLSLRAICKRGQTVAVESPTYFGVLQVIESLGLKALEIATHANDGIDVSALRASIKKNVINACVLMPSFSNPLGSLMPEGNKEQVVHMLEKANIPLIEDDVYGSLAHEGKRPPMAKSFEQQGGVIYCASFSKTLAPGMRLGWIVAGKHHDEIAYQKFLGNISTASLPQIALAEFLASPAYRRLQKKNIQTYKQRMEQLRFLIMRYFPAGTRLSSPKGGFILWVELPKSFDSMELYKQALQKGVAISPGILFSSRGQYKNHIRLSCGSALSESMVRGVKILGRLLASY